MTDIELSAREAIEIASGYGLPYRQFKGEIRECLEQARRYHLQPRSDGRLKTARQYFDGYMADVAHEVVCDEQTAFLTA